MTTKSFTKEAIGFTYYHLYQKFQHISGNRVLLYHSIGSKLRHDTYGISISRERFTEHLKYLKENFEIIALDESYQSNLDKKTISITFDDGYKDNLIALELCLKYDIPFTLYITSGKIGEKQYLDKNDILEFSKSNLCTIGAHSHTHPNLATLNYNEQYSELDRSKKTLENTIFKDIIHMSYPHGSYNHDTLKIVDELGYKMISSSHIGLNTKENLNLKKIKRMEIIANDNLKSLHKKIIGFYDYLAIMHR